MIGKFVQGEGPNGAHIMLVGEAPGKMEASIGRPFCGVSGAELNRYLLMQSGLRRKDCYVTNVVKYRPDEFNSDPSPQDIARDEPYLLAEIEQIKPKVIVPVGRIATSYFLGDIDLEFEYGLPHWSDKFNCYIFPLYHPAAGLHQADRYSKLIYNGFKRLGQFLLGNLEWKRDNNPCKYIETTAFYHSPEIAVDTEGYPTKPWGLSYSGEAGTGYVLTQVMPWLGTRSRYIFHNALWDLKVLRGLGYEIPYDKIEDNMLVAHLLCLEPKKLKALAYREAGMEMEEYKDVIKEADERISRRFLEHVFLATRCTNCNGQGEQERPWKRNPDKFTKEKCEICSGDGTTLPKPETQLIFNSDFSSQLYTPQSLGKRLRGIIDSGSNYRDKWNKTDYSSRKYIESTFGKLPQVSLDAVEPRERAITYSARDADATLRVYNKLRPRLKKMGLEEAYKIDLGCIPIIDRMHQNGILIDSQYLRDLDAKFATEQYQVLQKLYDEVGIYFSPTSPKQMKRELAKLGIPDLESTNERTLKLLKIQTDNPKVKAVIDLGLEFRELSKMRGTYTYRLIDEADENSRIHTTFILSAQEGEDSAEAPSTGRLSSRNPNLQNIPVGQGRGEMIRAAFIAKPGCSLLSVDLSQIELRVGAHLAHEAAMIEAFRSGKDLHTYTAAKMFNIPYDQVDKKKHRYPAKSINFGIFYGMTEYRLQSELAVEGITISLAEAKDFIEAWFAIYPGMREYMHNVQAEARQNYFVRTMFGRIRYLPNVHSKDPRAQAEALRQAGNHPVQGSSGDILKIAMANVHARIYPEFKDSGFCFEPLLSIHDEIIFEVSDEIAEYVAKRVAYEMEHAVKLDVPLLSSHVIAKDWSKLKE